MRHSTTCLAESSSASPALRQNRNLHVDIGTKFGKWRRPRRPPPADAWRLGGGGGGDDGGITKQEARPDPAQSFPT